MGTPILSSSLSPPPTSQPVRDHKTLTARTYRSTRQLPFELAQHVHVYFEESMFLQGFRLILSLASADASAGPKRPISIPSPEYLALTSTISIHPSFTSRTVLPEKWEQANSARRVLRLLLNTAGPVNTGFAEAFSFARYGPASPVKSPKQVHGIKSYYVEEGSPWYRAGDFWAVVGWALNCSCLPGMHASRWEYWRLWLEFMLDVLDADWQIHFDNDTCRNSLLWRYVKQAPGRDSVRARRMLRAIFADGSEKSLNEFREVFSKELKEPKRDTDKPKNRGANVDIEADIFGDYVRPNDHSDSMSESETAVATASNMRSTKRRRLRTLDHRTVWQAAPQSIYLEEEQDDDSDSNSTSITGPYLGSPQSLEIRLRLLHLLSHIAGQDSLTKGTTLSVHTSDSFPPLEELYTLYVEFISPLPLTTFQKFISSSLQGTRTFSIDAHVTLCEFILQRTLENSAPTSHTEEYLTVSKLVEEYLPYAASRNTVDANCRISLLLESLLRSLKQVSILKGKAVLTQSTEEGIQRRLNKTGDRDTVRKRRNGAGGAAVSASTGSGELSEDPKETDPEEIAMKWLIESGQRIRMIVASLKE